MAQRVFNEGADYPKGASVGPYWFVRDGSEPIRLIAHRCALADAEEYGDCLTSPHGHYDLWEGWRTGSAPACLTYIIRDADYEEWPRGRVVLNFIQRKFIVHGDRQVFEYGLRKQVMEYFGIPVDGHVEFTKDGHYQSTRSLRPRSKRSRS
jgi:hypothetical protein